MRKHAYPWETKKHDSTYAGFNPSMSNDEFITWLRYRAIEEGAPSRFLDRLGELGCATEEDIEGYVKEAKEEERNDCCNDVEYMGNKLELTEEQIKQIVDYLREDRE
jgi:hypothetical protein